MNDEVVSRPPKNDIHGTENDWTEYVLGHLTEDELVNDKFPRCDGLVRVCRKFMGEISIDTKVHRVGNEFASVTCYMTLLSNSRLVSGSAECTTLTNPDPKYGKYPLATAETRAIGRAAKRMLGLVNVLTSEEVSAEERNVAKEESDNREKGKIRDSQINAINNWGKRLDLDCKKSIEFILEKEYNIVRELTHEEAVKVLSTLNDWSRLEDKPAEITENYKDNWRND